MVTGRGVEPRSAGPGLHRTASRDDIPLAPARPIGLGFASCDRWWLRPSYDFQVGALREAGFREVGTFWQRRDNRVLLAVK